MANAKQEKNQANRDRDKARRSVEPKEQHREKNIGHTNAEEHNKKQSPNRSRW